jgi:hypothetical protein
VSLHFIEFLPEHLLFIMDVNENVMKEQQGLDLLEIGRKSKEGGPCLTLMEGDVAMACGGIQFIFEKSASVWIRLSSKAGPNVHKELRAQMHRWIEQHQLDRMQAVARADWESDQKYFEWMGMKREGVMRKYGPHGADQVLYAWVRKP